jgi:hypothetical protein
MDKALPPIGRTTFTLHLVVAIVIGLALLIAPLAFGAFFGYPRDAEMAPVVRALGAMMLGFGGLTSFYGMRASSWAQVDFVVRGEIAYLALQTLVFAGSAIAGNGPAFGNWAFAGLSAVLCALFAATLRARPTEASA